MALEATDECSNFWSPPSSAAILLSTPASHAFDSALFSIFGSRLAEGDGLFLAGALLAAALLLPLAFARTRGWLRQGFPQPEGPERPEAPRSD